jgi:glutaredoxin 3
MNATVVMYSTRFCPFCVRAKSLLDSKGAAYTDIGVDSQPQLRREMMQRSGRTSVPQIWVGEEHVGGFDDLARLEQLGQLDELLKLAS